MKKLLTLFIFVLVFVGSKNAVAQNLVPNSSFEYDTLCPDGLTRIYYAVPWTQPLPQLGTSDYYNYCSTGSDIQYCLKMITPKTGKAYAGIIIYGSDQWQEYIQVGLKDPLVIGKTYCVSFNIHLFNGTQYAIDRIGMLFSDTLVKTDNPHHPITTIPQIESPEFVYLYDTNNWQKITGSFVAVGGEKYITLGNFHTFLETNYITAVINSNQTAYYLFDDVSVYPCDAPVYTANAGGNKEICNKESVTLGAVNLPDYLYWWYDVNENLIDSVAQITVNPTATTKYYLKVKDFKFDESWDSITVTVNENCNNIVFIPNIFSPNSDGANDILYIRGENIKEASISIYNRWGENVFKTNDITKGWDGNFKGKPCPADVYVYYVNVTFSNGVIEQKKGNVTLVR
jgi:gliding motility-associated-like protein